MTLKQGSVFFFSRTMKSYLLPLLLFLSGIIIGDIWFRAGLFLVLTLVLVLIVFQRFRSAWLGIICLFVGYL